MEILAGTKEDFSVWLCRGEKKKKKFCTFWRLRQKGINRAGYLSPDFCQDKNQSETVKNKAERSSGLQQAQCFLSMEGGFGPSQLKKEASVFYLYFNAA